jgi:two-component system cell cycle response regulator DivK
MNKTVMIVEDDDLNMRLYQDLMSVAGFDTVATDDGDQALDLARRVRPDVILMDIELRAQSGLDATRRLKADATLCGIPVIAVTAHARSGDEQRLLAGGCADYVTKPISVEGLINTVRRHAH